MNRSKTDTLALFFKINFLVSCLFFLPFLIFNEESGTLYFTVPAVISTAALLYLIFYLVTRPFFRFYRFMAPLLIALFTVTNFLLIFDFFLFRIWKFHINAMVVNIVFSPAAYDSIQVGTAPYLIATVYFILFVAFEIWLLKFLNEREEKTARWNRFFNRTVVPLVLVIALSEKIYYGIQSLKANDRILESVKPIPLYQPLTFNRFASRYLGIEKVERKEVSVGIKKNAKVRYPLEPIRLENNRTVPIFIFGVDAVRADMVTPEIAPNIYAFSKEAIFYRNARSGGNCTRFGLFSFFYGLNSPYWFAFLNAKKGPVFFQVLQKLGYDIGIYYSTDTRWPEFRQTIFYDVRDKIHDRMPGAPWQKDKELTQRWTLWLKTLDHSKPIFSFLFLDAPHGRSYPQNDAIFQPDGGRKTNYATADAKDRIVLFNQYKNAIHYDDMLIGKMLQALKQKGWYDRSIIVIISDHGEEFFERGHFSHNNAFDKEQTNSLLIIKMPGKTPKRIDRLVSANDFIPSLLKLLGVQNDLSTFSNAKNLFAEEYKRNYVTCGNWYHNAIITPKYTFVFSNLPNEILKTKVYRTDDYKRIDNPNYPQTGKIIMEILNDNRKFIK